MLHLNDAATVKENKYCLREFEIREILKQFEVGNIVNGVEILPIRYFLIEIFDDSYDNTQFMHFASAAQKFIVDGRPIKTHYYESNVNKILSIIEDGHAIKSIL